MEPQSWLGGIYLRLIYDSEDQDLQKISSYLSEATGGLLPHSYDRYLFRRLERAEPDSPEFRNIIGFYASQSITSQAGRRMYEDGGRFLPSVIRYGREATPDSKQEGYLFLAYSIALEKRVYKPSLSPLQSMDDGFTHIENGELQKVRISSP